MMINITIIVLSITVESFLAIEDLHFYPLFPIEIVFLLDSRVSGWVKWEGWDRGEPTLHFWSFSFHPSPHQVHQSTKKKKKK